MIEARGDSWFKEAIGSCKQKVSVGAYRDGKTRRAGREAVVDGRREGAIPY
jgi:hypothetical protein